MMNDKKKGYSIQMKLQIQKRIYIIFLSLSFLFSAYLFASESPQEERVDLFELIYVFPVAEVSHSGISAHGPHWVWWRKDAIFCLIDKDKKSWLQTKPDNNFTAEFLLKAPIRVNSVSLTALELHKTNEFSPVRWAIQNLDERGNVIDTIADSTILKSGEDKVTLKKTIEMKRFRLTAVPVDSKGNPKPSGEKTVRLSDLSLFGQQDVAFLAIAPATRLTFDLKFYPYVISMGNEFTMRAWKIFSTGQSVEDSSGIQWFTSNPKVAVVSRDGRVRTLAKGEAIISGAINKDIFASVPIRVIDYSEGTVDLDVIYIDRLIKDKSGNLTKRNWGDKIDQPQSGENLVFQAHILNNGWKETQSAKMRWWIDGSPGGEKVINHPFPNCGALRESGQVLNLKTKKGSEESEATVSLPVLCHTFEVSLNFLEIPYDGKRHRITFEIFPLNESDENPYNNSLTVWSDGITFGYYMSETTYYAYSLIQKYGWKDLPENFKIPHEKVEWGPDEWKIISSNAYDRFQRIVRVFNRQFEMSKHHLTPNGITERINGIMYIIPDPDNDEVYGLNFHKIGAVNRTIDLIWGLIRSKDKSVASYTYERMIELFREGTYSYIDTPLIHEVSHARYLIDLYGGGIQNKEIHILDEKGNRVFPDNDEPVYDRKLRFERKNSGRGMMVGGTGYENGWSEHGAYSWERIRGRRAREGTWNAPPELGEFLNTIPDSNIIKVVTTKGQPVAGAKIEVFQSVHGPWGEGGGIYSKHVDNNPDITCVTNRNGEAELGAYPFASVDEKNPQKYRWHPKGVFGYNGEANAIIRITAGQKSFYKVLTVFDSNLGYWYKYGLKVQNYPHIRVAPESKLTYVFTISPDWSSDNEKQNRAEIPKTY